jgi:hypothetical protein
MFFYMCLEKHLCNAMSRGPLIHDCFYFFAWGGRGEGDEGGGGVLDVRSLGSFEEDPVFISLVCMYGQRRNLYKLCIRFV